jgi:hypothetical protein
LKSIDLLDGPEARLLNLSRGGVLIQTAARMMPGATIYLRLVATDAVFLVQGRVMRSRASLLRDSILLYESAVAFDGNFPLRVDDTAAPLADVTPASLALKDESLSSMPLGQAASAEERPPAAYRVTATVSRSGPDLHQIFGLNSW